MRRHRIGSGFAIAAAAVALALTVLPGAAEARTASDERCLGPDQQFLVCTEVTAVPAYDNAWVGAPIHYPESDVDARTWNLPPGDPNRCQGENIIGGTQDYPMTFAYMWQWDFWVDGGAWVLWDGEVLKAPLAGTLPSGYGLTTLAVGLGNWNVYDDIDARVFWVCFPPNQGYRQTLSSRAASGPSATLTPPPAGLHRSGDEGDDSLRGDEQDNALRGFAGEDRLVGGDGEDHLHAGAGDDSLSGGDHADLLHAHTGDDRVSGGSGVDDILSGKGDDVSKGGGGGDQLFDNQGKDHLRGGPGNDRFSAHDGDRDRIDCGPGEDIALIDRKDVAIDCEHVYRSAREAPKKMPKI